MGMLLCSTNQEDFEDSPIIKHHREKAKSKTKFNNSNELSFLDEDSEFCSQIMEKISPILTENLFEEKFHKIRTKLTEETQATSRKEDDDQVLSLQESTDWISPNHKLNKDEYKPTLHTHIYRSTGEDGITNLHEYDCDNLLRFETGIKQTKSSTNRKNCLPGVNGINLIYGVDKLDSSSIIADHDQTQHGNEGNSKLYADLRSNQGKGKSTFHKRVKSGSFDSLRETLVQSPHPVLAAAQLALQNHTSFILDKTHIWMLIIQGVNKHYLNTNSKHPISQKIDLVVYRDSSFDLESNVEWESVIDDFGNLLKEEMDEMHSFFVNSFTLQEDKLTAIIILMSTFQNYFNFVFKITESSQKEDEKNAHALKNKLDFQVDCLNNLGLNDWFAALDPILNNIINASSKNLKMKIDMSFRSFSHGGVENSLENLSLESPLLISPLVSPRERSKFFTDQNANHNEKNIILKKRQSRATKLGLKMGECLKTEKECIEKEEKEMECWRKEEESEESSIGELEKGRLKRVCAGEEEEGIFSEDLSLWDRCYMRHIINGEARIGGWITTFFPPNAREPNSHKFNEWKGSSFFNLSQSWGIKESSFPQSYAAAPLSLHTHNASSNTNTTQNINTHINTIQLIAGFAGVSQVHSTFKTLIGWAVSDNPSYSFASYN
jgi:hypothetical protein